jgi:hypothetical protein
VQQRYKSVTPVVRPTVAALQKRHTGGAAALQKCHTWWREGCADGCGEALEGEALREDGEGAAQGTCRPRPVMHHDDGAGARARLTGKGKHADGQHEATSSVNESFPRNSVENPKQNVR